MIKMIDANNNDDGNSIDDDYENKNDVDNSNDDTYELLSHRCSVFSTNLYCQFIFILEFF